jgi:hypothetical protein
MRPKTYAPDSKNQNPGPGAYDTDFKDPHGPKYTLRPKTQAPRAYDNPGPGTYEETSDPVKYKFPQWKIGSEKRDKLIGYSDVPGPGQYEDPRALKKAGTKFGKEEGRAKSASEKAPGPGNYPLEGQFEEGLRTKKGKTFGLKTEIDAKNTNPAPSTYDPEVYPVRPSQSKWSFGKGTRDDGAKNLNPAPCDYDINDTQVHPSGPQWGMGSSAQRGEGTNETKFNPGPGAYDPGLPNDSSPH